MTKVLAALLLAVALQAPMWPQGLTGQISGTVRDPAGAVIPAVHVTLTNTETAQARAAVTDSAGSFVFNELLRGTYSLSVKHTGFKDYEQRDVELTSSERVVLGQIQLELGNVSERMTVTAQAARLQTQSSERAGLISSAQITDLSLKGRDFLGFMGLIPGVVDTANRDAPTANNIAGITVNGRRQTTINLTVDGVSDLDPGSMNGNAIAPGMDAIAEVKVLSSNAQAEYGRASTAINVVTKNGTREFHGGAYYFKRNEAFNANEFFNNRDGLPRPQYRYDFPGYNLGGPVRLPGFNRDRNKLFFFWSQEFLPRKLPSPQGRLTFPTAAERKGDFSQTLDTNGKLIPIMDPFNSRLPFPGNIVPANRINKSGQGLLNVFPLPNTTDPTHTFNTVFQDTIEQPRREEILRVDYNVGSKTSFYARGVIDHQAFRGDYGSLQASQSFQIIPTNYEIIGRGVVATLIHTFTPTVLNEFTFGVNRGLQTTTPISQEGIDRFNRVKLGLDLPQFHPELNPYNVIPRATFGGVSRPPQIDIDQRYPFSGDYNLWNWSDNLTLVRGKHNLKFGLYFEKTSRNGSRVSTPMGEFDFGRDVNNPFDTNYAYANTLLGTFRSYTESDARPYSHGRYTNTEWFAQDNWRVSKRLTFDLGVRFYRIVPTASGGDKIADFSLASWDPKTAPALIVPYKASATAARQGRNPVTGALTPEILIGTYALGSGNINDGMDVGYEQLLHTPPIQIAPRVGFAWDVFGDGKTAVRGGFGIYYDRFSDTTTLRLVQQPPLVNTATEYYGTIPQLLSAPLSLSPSSVFATQRTYAPPSTYSWSFGIQRDIGFATVLDVAYVASMGRHLLQVRNLNATAYGTNFLPSSIDSTVAGNKPLPANLLKPIRGYTDINYNEFAATSNYHSMQTQVNRRLRHGVSFGASWTWSKAMDLGDGDGSAVNSQLNYRMRNYGKAGFDRTHTVAVNYIWDVPKASSLWNNGFTRRALDNWTVSGITSFVSGAPLGISYSFVTATDITGANGAGIDSRVILTGNPNLPKSDRTHKRFFDTSVVRPPDPSNFGIGNASKDPLRGPGINNWDISVYKNIPLGKEARRLQFRFETYNTFNHAQFTAVDTGARFDAAGNQVNSRLGEYTASASARRLQLGLKFYF